MAAAKTVADMSDARIALARSWPLIDALCGGTEAMRDARETYLMMEEGETIRGYEIRLSRTILYEAFNNTRRRLRSKPMSRDVMIHGDLPPTLQGIEKNFDGQGQNLTQFAGSLIDDGVKRGLTHVLCSYPNVAQPGEDARSRRKRLNAGVEKQIRPYAVHVKAEDLLGWESEPDPVYGRKLTMVRFREKITIPWGEWGTRDIEQVRVLRPGSWQIWRAKGREREWYVYDEGESAPLTEIPFSTIYFARTDFMMAEPPLLDLAWQSLHHWQSGSDQTSLMHFARSWILFGAGFNPDEKKPTKYGASRFLKNADHDAKLEVVEHSGAAINAGRQDLLDIEARMEVLGLAPLMERTGGVTATGSAINESKSTSDLQSWIRAVEAGLRQTLEHAAMWKGVELAKEVDVDVFNDFGITARGTAEIAALMEARRNGDISARKLLMELKRRTVLSEDSDIDSILEEARADAGVDGLTRPDDARITPAA